MDDRGTDIRREYCGRINRVMDYIDENLAENLSLDQLAAIANFSKYHFHRIFYAETGETLFKFIQRLRVERAALLLCSQKRKSITEIAMDVGFSGPAAFAKAFRGIYGVSASAWRNGAFRNLGKTESNTGKAPDTSSVYNDGQRGRNRMGIENLSTAVIALKTLSVAYIRHTGRYQGDEELFQRLFTRLYSWAGPRDLLEVPGRRDIVVYHDSPGLTDDTKLRISVGMTVPRGTEVSGEIGHMEIPGGKYVVARFKPGPREYGSAWTWVFGEWMPSSGWQPADSLSFEMYDPDVKPDEEGRCIVDICVPVQPL